MDRAKGGARKPLRLPLGRHGVTALEFAFVAPIAFLLLFGIVELGRTFHTRSALQFAVEQAARCAAVNRTLCGTPGQTQAYAASRMIGASIPSSSFTSTQPACGQKVTASVNLAVKLPRPLPQVFTLTAASCYPLL